MFTPTHPTTTPLPGAAPLPGLAGEIGKRTPFSLPEQEAYLNIVRTAATLSTHFADLLRQHDLSEATYNILRILRGSLQTQPCPSLNLGPTCSAIGSAMITQVPDVTRLVDRLEHQGLAQRSRCDKDRRVVHVKITPAGLALLAELDQPLTDLHKATLGHLSPTELSTLSSLLTKARTPTHQTTSL
jgi:DNA-binding MarR family transcriptional regulator